MLIPDEASVLEILKALRGLRWRITPEITQEQLREVKKLGWHGLCYAEKVVTVREGLEYFQGLKLLQDLA
jgi:hypothetical protein